MSPLYTYHSAHLKCPFYHPLPPPLPTEAPPLQSIQASSRLCSPPHQRPWANPPSCDTSNAISGSSSTTLSAGPLFKPAASQEGRCAGSPDTQGPQGTVSHNGCFARTAPPPQQCKLSIPRHLAWSPEQHGDSDQHF